MSYWDDIYREHMRYFYEEFLNTSWHYGHNSDANDRVNRSHSHREHINVIDLSRPLWEVEEYSPNLEAPDDSPCYSGLLTILTGTHYKSVSPITERSIKWLFVGLDSPPCYSVETPAPNEARALSMTSTKSLEKHNSDTHQTLQLTS